MGIVKKYLSQQELNNFLLVGVLLDTAATVRKEWMERGNLTKEEHKFLKTAETNMTKFYENVMNRLDNSELEKIAKKSAKFTFRILDDYTLNKLNRDTIDKMKNAAVPREQFESWCSEIMEVHCRGCTKNQEGCELNTIFEDNFVPESTWSLENCRYAYNERDKIKDIKKIKEYQAFRKKRLGV